MRSRTEIVSWALIAAAVVAAVVVVVDRDRPTTKEQASRAGLLLRVFRADDITRITLQRRDEKIEIVREGEGWKLTSPRVAKADFLAVTSFVNALQGARAERSVGKVEGSERVQLGLDAPRAKIEIAMKGVTLQLALGAPATGAVAADGGALASYLEVAPYGDDKGGVFVVGPEVVAALDRTSDAFREPSLTLGHPSTTFTRVEIRNVVTLDRAPHGTWRIPTGVPGAPVRADIDVVDGLFRAFYDLKADPFVKDDTKVDVARGGVVVVQLASGSRLNLEFGGACPSDPKLVVVRSEGIATGCVPQVVTDRLLLPAASYVDRHAFALIYGSESAKISEIESVLVEANGAKVLDVERRASGLHMRAPSDEQIDNEQSNAYLARLAAVVGTFVPPPHDLAALGLSPPAGKVTLRRRVDKTTLGPMSVDGGGEVWDQIVEVSAPLPDDPQKKDGPRVVHVRRLDDGAVLRVPLDLAGPIREGAAHAVRNPNLLALSAESVLRVAVKPSEGIAWELDRKSGAWQLVAPKGLGADASAANEVAKNLATLTCLRWAAEKDDGTFGFATPSAVVEVERKLESDAGGEKTLALELGGATPDGGWFARVRGRDPVCVLPGGKRDLLLKPPIDPRAVSFDATETPKLVATADKRTRTVTFDPKTTAWKDGTAPGGAADVLAAKIADSIKSLRAEAVVHLGPARKEHGFDAPTLVVEGFDGATSKKKLVVGTLGKLDKLDVYFARVQGIDATYAIPRFQIDDLLAQL